MCLQGDDIILYRLPLRITIRKEVMKKKNERKRIADHMVRMSPTAIQYLRMIRSIEHAKRPENREPSYSDIVKMLAEKHLAETDYSDIVKMLAEKHLAETEEK